MTTTSTAIGTNKRTTITLVIIAVALYWASLYFYVPTLPVVAEQRTGGDLVMVGVIISMYGLWQAIVRLPLGILTDWLGRRKPFLILGFGLAALGAWLMGTSEGSQGLLVGRAITGLAAATWVPLVVLFSSLFPPQEAVRASALLSMVNSISRMAATGANGVLNDVGGYGLAFFVAAAVAGLAILAVLPVREAARAPQRPSLRGIGRLVIRPDVLVPALLSALAQYVAWATTFGFIPIMARNLGASDYLQGILVTLNIGVSLAGNLFLSAYALRIGNRKLVILGFGISLVGVLIAAAAPALGAGAAALALVVAATVLLGIGFGVAYPLLMGMSIENVDETERATAMGLHQAVYAIGMFAGPSFSGLLAERFGIPMMLVLTVIGTALLAALLLRRLRK